jgi:DNA-binding response OmpR family regulator
MAELQHLYRSALAGRIEALERARDRLLGGDEAAVDAIRRVAHALRGSGGTYGFPEVSAAAGAVEEVAVPELADELGRLLDVLRGVATLEGISRVLVVDDDPEMQHILRAVLAAPDRELVFAGGLAEAGPLIRTESFALVVLDLQLADGDGRTLLLAMRDRPATARVPLIILSGSGESDVKSECFALGADVFFDKPLDPQTLAAAVSAELRRHPPDPTGAPPGGAGRAAPPDLVDALAPSPSVGGAVSAPRLLLVEDDPLVSAVVKHRLEREGFEVVHLDDGVAALEEALARPPAMAILDVKVPGIDGLELLQKLREEPATRAIRIVMLTSLGSEEDVVRALELGADDYIVKPFSPVEVVARIQRLLEPPRTGAEG